MVLVKDTLLTIFKDIIKDKRIMDLMSLPTVYDEDEEEIVNRKKALINKAIMLSSQNPNALGGKFPKVTIEGEEYENYAKMRMTICSLQSETASTDFFIRPRIQINIFHLNEDVDKALEIIDILINKFSRKKIDIEWTDEAGYKHITPRELTFRGVITPSQNINFYEKSGVRFSCYAPSYSPFE